MSEEIDHEYTEEITCPHCGYEFGDSWEVGGGNNEDLGKLKCFDCEKEFTATRNISVDYSTTKLSCEEQGEKHEQIFDSLHIRKRKYEGGGVWNDLPEDKWEYKKIMECTKCDETEYVEITREEYEKMKDKPIT